MYSRAEHWGRVRVVYIYRFAAMKFCVGRASCVNWVEPTSIQLVVDPSAA